MTIITEPASTFNPEDSSVSGRPSFDDLLNEAFISRDDPPNQSDAQEDWAEEGPPPEDQAEEDPPREDRAQDDPELNFLKGWHIHPLADAFVPRPPLEYVVKDMIVRPSLNITFGVPGSLKSMVVADMAACVVAGKVWLPPLPGDSSAVPRGFSTTKTSAIWIDLDNGDRPSAERFEAVARGHEIPEDSGLFYVTMPQPCFNASQPTQIDDLIIMCRQRKFGLVVVDNLGLSTGDISENESGMAKVMGNLRRLAESANVAVIVIHHQNKGSTIAGQRKGDKLRGHSSIEASLDLALMVERKADSDSITLTPTKVRGFNFPAVGALFTYDHKPNSIELEKVKFYAQHTIPQSHIEQQALEETILATVAETMDRSNPVSQKHLVELIQKKLSENEKLSIGFNAVRGAVNKLVREGKLETHTGKNNATHYAIPDES